MRKKFLVYTSFVAAFAAISAAFVFAQEPSPAERSDVMRTLQREQIDTRRATLQETMQKHIEVRTNIITNRRETQDAMRERLRTLPNLSPADRQKTLEEMKGMHAKMLEENTILRENFRSDLAERRKAMEEKLTTNRMMVREKLAKISDERKKALVEKLDKHFEEIDNKLLDHFTKVADRLDGLLEKIETRTDKAEAAGKDVANVRTAVTKAHSLVDVARVLITAQASKTYPINVTTEDKLGPAVSASRDALHEDLKKVREALHDARQGIGDALRALEAIPHVDDESSDDGNDNTATSTNATSTTSN